MILGFMPFVYYIFDYVTSIYTSLLYSGLEIVGEFLGFVLCLTYLMFLFLYFKEYNEIAKKYKDEKPHGTPDEFLSKMKKTDRLHSVLTICIYYGETPWDGPRSLIDMLEIPDAFKPLISDYKFNLIELRNSEHLKFHNDDVDKIFNISRFIFDEKYDKITDIFKEENISSELAMVIGCITESQKLINTAVNAQQEGGNVNMCKALEKLEEKGRQEGELKTRSEEHTSELQSH